MEAQYRLGYMYCLGIDREKPNYEEAVKWYTMAADQGHVTAKQRLGTLYLEGLGVPKNETEAKRLYEEAGDSVSKKYLDYLNTPQPQAPISMMMAMKEKAEKGDAEAQVYMGMLYEHGHAGVPQDKVEAYKWYTLAKAKDPALVEDALEQLGSRLSPEQIDEAKSLVANWRETHHEHQDRTHLHSD